MLSSVCETTRSLGTLALQLGLVGGKGRVAHLLYLRTLVLFRQTVLAAKLEAAMRAFSNKVDGRILALPVGTGTILTSLFGASTKTKDQVKSGFLLNVVVRQSATIFELLAGKDKTLLIRRNAFLVLDLGLDVVDGVRRLDFESDGLACERLDKDLHTTAESQYKVKRRLFLNVVVGERSAVFELLTSEDETLLIRRNAFLVLDLGLDVVDGVRGLDFESNGLARERLNKNLHLFRQGRVAMASEALQGDQPLMTTDVKMCRCSVAPEEDEQLLTVRARSGGWCAWLCLCVCERIDSLVFGDCADRDDWRMCETTKL